MYLLHGPKFFSPFLLISRVDGPSVEPRSVSYFSIPNFLKWKFLIFPLFSCTFPKTGFKSKVIALEEPHTKETTVN